MPTEGEKTADKVVGRTRGGLNTKLHAIVDGLGNPVVFMLSTGSTNDFLLHGTDPTILSIPDIGTQSAAVILSEYGNFSKFKIPLKDSPLRT